MTVSRTCQKYFLLDPLKGHRITAAAPQRGTIARHPLECLETGHGKHVMISSVAEREAESTPLAVNTAWKDTLRQGDKQQTMTKVGASTQPRAAESDLMSGAGVSSFVSA